MCHKAGHGRIEQHIRTQRQDKNITRTRPLNSRRTRETDGQTDRRIHPNYTTNEEEELKNLHT